MKTEFCYITVVALALSTASCGVEGKGAETASLSRGDRKDEGAKKKEPAPAEPRTRCDVKIHTSGHAVEAASSDGSVASTDAGASGDQKGEGSVGHDGGSVSSAPGAGGDAEGYWTEERMKNAKPAPMPAPNAGPNAQGREPLVDGRSGEDDCAHVGDDKPVEKGPVDVCTVDIALPECAASEPTQVTCSFRAGKVAESRTYRLQGGQYCRADLSGKVKLFAELCAKKVKLTEAEIEAASCK